MSNTSKKSIDLTPKPLPGGKRVVTCSGDKTIRIWDVENGEQEGTSMDDDSWVVGLAVTRDGKRILSGGNAKGIKVWDVETHELIEEWEGYTDGISCIAMSPDDQLAASGDGKGKIVIREMKEGGQIKHSIKAGKWVNSVSFSSNGKKLASAVDEYEDGRTIYAIRIYDVESGELVLGPIKGHKNIVHCVLWSLDGSQLFSTADDGTIRCWNSETGEPIGQSWTGHTHWVTSSSLSPDGTKLASASYDKHVRLWDAHSGEPIEQPLQHEHELCAVTFSPSGEFVASAGNDNVSIWRVPWWDDSQKQAHDSLLDLPAVPAPKGLSNNQALYQPDFLDLPTTRRPITPTSQPLADPANPTARPVVTRVQHFWRGLVTYRSSSLRPVIELQPIEGRHFWKSPVRVPVTEVAAGRMTDRYAVGRRIRRRKKKEDKPQTHAASSATEAGPSSSHPEPSGSTSNVRPSNSQAGPSNVAIQGRPSNFAPSDVGSDDSWDDMDCCGQCLDYFCVGPRANREKFRPWKKKSRAVLEAEERAREEKGREEARKHRKNNNPTRTQNVARLSHHHSSQRDHVIAVTGASPASPHADEATPQRSRASQSHGGGQGVTSQSQEQIEQLRRQLDEAVAARRKAEAERDASEKRVEELQHSGHDPRKPQASQPQVVVEGGPSSSHMMPSGSTSNAGPSTLQAVPSISSDGTPTGRPSTFAASLALD